MNRCLSVRGTYRHEVLFIFGGGWVIKLLVGGFGDFAEAEGKM